MTILENGYHTEHLTERVACTNVGKRSMQILCNAGIKHILLKGMALEHTLYGARGSATNE